MAGAGTAHGHEHAGGEHERPRHLLIDVVAILAMIGIAFAGRQAFQDLRRDDDPRDPHRVEAVAQRFATPSHAVGDCLTGDASDRLSVVVEVDCDAPHLAEVVAEVDFPAPDLAPYPSELGWSAFFASACIGPASEQLGRPVTALPSVFNAGLVPTPEQWRIDDARTVLCTVEAAFEPDGSRPALDLH
jgi:hypothetical protein